MSDDSTADDGIEQPGSENRLLPVVIAQAPEKNGISAAAACDAIIRRHVYWSMGAGVIPLILVDTAALLAIQIRMVREIARIYDVPFRRDSVRSAAGALLSSATATAFGAGLLSSGLMRGVIHAMPVVGPAISLATMPAFYAAFTYATGKVYQRHFASGGTFLTFDPTAVGEHFQAMFEEKRRAV